MITECIGSFLELLNFILNIEITAQKHARDNTDCVYAKASHLGYSKKNMDSPSEPNQQRREDGASKKKYAVMYGYCGTGYQGSQTYFVLPPRDAIETRVLIRLMMI